jgi:hypothetical protein
MNITKLIDGYQIENSIILFADQYVPHQINLAKTQWPIMNYGKHDAFVIDYPGDYDKDDIDITCFAENDGILDYMIHLPSGSIGIIQTAKWLEFAELNNIQTWIVPEKLLADQLIKMEVEWEIVVLDDLWWEDTIWEDTNESII